MPTIVDWSQKFDFGGPRSTAAIRNVFIHTAECPTGTPAENVANYQLTARNGSYHYLADSTGKLLRENTDDWVAWGTGNRGNDVGLHISLCTYAANTRAQWLKLTPMLQSAAWQVARWCKAYDLPVTAVTPTDLRRGVKGISTHDGARLAWGGTDHTDPGPNFPMDVFLGYVRGYLKDDDSHQPSGDEPMTPSEKKILQQAADDAAAARRYARDTWLQVTGGPEYTGFEQGGGRTLYDLAAAIAAKIGVERTKDMKPK